MRVPALALLSACAMAATPAAAQQTYEGNWECLKGPTPAGILTLYTPSYGFASQTFGDPTSGSGAIEGYTDGVQFSDGNLKKSGVEAGRIVDIGGQQVMQLESQSEIIMICTPRQDYTGGMFGTPNAPPPPGMSVTPTPAPAEQVAPVPAGPRPN